MIEIKIKNPQDEKEFDKAVKSLKKIMSKEGIIQEIRERRYYEKPSDKKRRERNSKKRRK